MRGVLPLLVAATLLPAAGLADEVFLKGGGHLSGRITQRTATSLQVDVGAGLVTVPADRVERVVEGATALDEYDTRARALKPGDAQGWRALGDWAAAKGLGTQSRQAYEKALAIAPDDPAANQALGRVQVGGRWVSEEEGYRARGYVKFEGEWMTPAEQASIEADRARSDADTRVREAEARARAAEAAADEARAKQEKAEAEQAQEGLPLWYGWAPGPNAWPGASYPQPVPVQPVVQPRRP